MRANLLAIVCVMTFGCAQLSVQVDILDPVATDIANEEGVLRRLYFKVARETSQNVVDEVEALRKKHSAANKQLGKIYKKLADEQSNLGLKRILSESAEELEKATFPGGALYPLYTQLQKVIIEGNAEILRVARNTSLKAGEPIPPDLRAVLVARRDAERIAKEPLLQTLRAAKSELAQEVPEEERTDVEMEAQAVVAPVEKALKSIIGGPTLVGSEFAYPVVFAPEELWAPHFNYAKGKGTFGDADIVIKMGGQGDFTVKGMQFDPSAVAAMASKVVTQSLLLAAQIAGVPVSSNAIQDSTAKSKGFVGAGDQVISIDQKLTEREAKIKAWKAAIRDIAQSILSEETSIIKGSNDDRIATGKAVNAIYDAYKDTLKLNNLN